VRGPAAARPRRILAGRRCGISPVAAEATEATIELSESGVEDAESQA
jgi:hypothetical protein